MFRRAHLKSAILTIFGKARTASHSVSTAAQPKGAGALTLADGAFPAIPAEKNLAIRYKAKVSASKAVTNVNAATIVFTIAAVSEKEAA